MTTMHPAGRAVLSLAVFVLSFLLHPSAFPQGPLAPTAAPTPTMKSLDQIEPRTLITSLPFTIGSPGSYVLIGNPIGASGSNGITVNADNVTIDLNGFEMVGGGGASSGIAITGLHNNVTIKNGTLLLWTTGGVTTASSSNSEIHVENLRVISCGSGLGLGDNGTAENCEVRANTGDGISGGSSCKVIKCRAVGQTGAFADGIVLGANSIVTDCIANNNVADGIRVGNGSKVAGCVSSNNTSNGFTQGTLCALSDCAAVGNVGNGFGGGSRVTFHNCGASSNGSNGLSGGSGCTLSNCTANSNSGSGLMFADATVMQNCSTFGNVGPGITVTLASSITNCASEGDQGTSAISANSACAIIGCVVRASTNANATSAGITTGTESLVSRCVVSNVTSTNATLTSSTGMGISAGSASMVEHNTIQGCKGDGIRITSSSLVLGNICDRNGATTGDGAGVHVVGNENRIEGNSVTGNDRGIDVDSAGNLVIKNTAATNTTAYQIAVNNRFGPIINITGAGVAPQNINDASANVASVLGSTDPWANFLY